MTTNQKHTPEAIPCPLPEVSEGEVQKRVDELTAKIIEGETRSLICLQALAGIDDPAAFMRDVRHLAIAPNVSWAARVKQHLKGFKNDR